MRGEEGENNSGPGFLRPSCPSYIVLMRELGVMPVRLEIIKLAARHWRRSKLSLRSRMAILNIAIIDTAPHGVVFVGFRELFRPGPASFIMYCTIVLPNNPCSTACPCRRSFQIPFREPETACRGETGLFSDSVKTPTARGLLRDSVPSRHLFFRKGSSP